MGDLYRASYWRPSLQFQKCGSLPLESCYHEVPLEIVGANYT